MAITIPNAFSAGTIILSSQVNENFDEIAERALDKTGDTITGNISVSAGVTVDGVDISSVLPDSGQVAFPAAQNASADANTLDDYEEGTYTPTWSSGGAAPALGDGTIAGSYIKVGKQVTVHIKLIMGATTTYGNTANGWTFSVPFTSRNGSVRYCGTLLITDSGTGFFTGVSFIEPNAAVVNATPSNGGSTESGNLADQNPVAAWAANDRIDISLTYEASA